MMLNLYIYGYLHRVCSSSAPATRSL
ncbi:MAG: hypothetical protein LBU85_07865 [Treponema sp.]|nr:hypothetical protein [Treponema sp.]